MEKSVTIQFIESDMIRDQSGKILIYANSFKISRHRMQFRDTP